MSFLVCSQIKCVNRIVICKFLQCQIIRIVGILVIKVTHGLHVAVQHQAIIEIRCQGLTWYANCVTIESYLVQVSVQKEKGSYQCFH